MTRRMAFWIAALLALVLGVVVFESIPIAQTDQPDGWREVIATGNAGIIAGYIIGACMWYVPPALVIGFLASRAVKPRTHG